MRKDPAERSGPSCPGCREIEEGTSGKFRHELYDHSELCPSCSDTKAAFDEEDEYDGTKTPHDRGSDPARRSNYDPRTR